MMVVLSGSLAWQGTHDRAKATITLDMPAAPRAGDFIDYGPFRYDPKADTEELIVHRVTWKQFGFQWAPVCDVGTDWTRKTDQIWDADRVSMEQFGWTVSAVKSPQDPE